VKDFLINCSPFLLFFLLFGGMEWAIRVFKVPAWLVAPPSATFLALLRHFPAIWSNLQITLQEIVFGYLIGVFVGILLALVFTSNRFLDKAISPYVVFLIVTPQMIMVPLLMLWMGFGIQVKLLAVALSAFPINMMSTMTGIRNVSLERYELMKSLHASKLQTFFRVLIPSALPNVFTGMRLGTIFATTSAIGAELISGNTGVGPQISYNTEFIMMDIAFANVYVMILVAVLFYCLIAVIEHFVIYWKY
jgi:NitT/TauT family transport system permease protein